MSAQTTPSQLAKQWRDVTYALPSADWHLLTPDPEPQQAGHRLLLEHQESLHTVQLAVGAGDAPAALAPTEVASKFFDSMKASTRPDGTFSDWKTGSRAIRGTTYSTLSLHFTPASGPPVTDETELVLFPGDYDQRQRWLLVRWIDTHSATTGRFVVPR